MEIKSKNYNELDYIKIPLKVAPVIVVSEIIFRILLGFLPSLQVIATKKFIDMSIDIFKNGNTNRIYNPLIAILFIIIFSFLSESILSFFKLEVNLRLNKELLPALIKKEGNLQFKYIEDNESLSLISRVQRNLTENIQNGFENLLDIVEMVVKIGSIFVLIGSKTLETAIGILVFSIPLLLLAFKSGKVNYDAYVEAEKYKRKADYLKDILSSREAYLERSLFGYTQFIDKVWKSKYEDARKIEYKADKQIFIKTNIASIITTVLSMTILFVLLFPVGQGKITVGMYIGLVTAVLNLVEQMAWNLTFIIQDYSKYKLYLEDFSELSKMEEVKGADKSKDLSIRDMPFESIEFKNVSFAYPGTSTKVLNNFSMYIEKNKHYAIVGKNGAGKTTFIKLLTGLYDNYEGEILINGKNIRNFTYEQLKAYFSIVYQDFAKYFINIKDNVLLGDYGERFASEEQEKRVKKVLKDMNMEDDVNLLKKGIYTLLGKLEEDGVDLSGGQWQKIALSRTLISNAPFYILDEPTAALDPISESKLYELFSKVSTEKSMFLITHRLGAVRICDEIFVIDKGTVIEHGTHEELIENKGAYAEMFEAQRSWYNEEE